jgi:hypothetical protein
VATSDVHVHAHRADLAPETGNRADSGRKSARTPATQARVIPLRTDLRQEDPEKKSERAGRGSRSPLEAELAAGWAVVAETAQASEYARAPMTPVEAAKQVAPARGEAGNWMLWSAMTAAGVARLVLVSVGHLIAHGGETRLRAAVVTMIFLLALAGGYLAGLA